MRSTDRADRRRHPSMTILSPYHTDVASNWEARLAHIVATMREMSGQSDPQEMSRAYGRRMSRLRPLDRMVSISRRDLEAPAFRITRCSLWKEEINPWKE